jgi:hypothetical protein
MSLESKIEIFEKKSAEALMAGCKPSTACGYQYPNCMVDHGITLSVFAPGCFLLKGPDGVAHKHGARCEDPNGKVSYVPYGAWFSYDEVHIGNRRERTIATEYPLLLDTIICANGKLIAYNGSLMRKMRCDRYADHTMHCTWDEYRPWWVANCGVPM